MGTTPLGIVYPDSTAHTRLWEHFQTLAEDVDGLITTLQTPPQVRAYNNSGVSLTNNTLTLITLGAESAGFKTAAGMHSTSSNTSRLIALVNGIYNVSWMVSFPANATNRRVSQIRKNAAGVAAGGTQLWSLSQAASATSGTTVGFSDDVSLLANDYIEMFAQQNSGGTMTNDTGEFNTFVNMRLVRYL